MSELGYLKTFIEEVTTALTVTTYVTRHVSKGRKDAWIEPGELLSVDGSFYKKRFKIKLRTTTEAMMTGFINEIIDGCITFNKRLGGLTFPAVMCNIKFVYTNKTFVEGEIWKNDIFLDIEFSTS